MANIMINAAPPAIDYAAMERCSPTWERQMRQWNKLNRIELTGEQCKALIENVEDTPYFSSEMLVNPSIEEFTVLIKHPDAPDQTTCMMPAGVKPGQSS